MLCLEVTDALVYIGRTVSDGECLVDTLSVNMRTIYTINVSLLP